MSPEQPSLAERIAIGAGRLLMSLPAPLQLVLSGGRPVRRDGQELAADVQLMLLLLRLQGHRPLDTRTPQEARADIQRSARLVGPGEAVAAVEPMPIPGPAATIPARLYRPPGESRPRPLVVYYHGGGWVVGGFDTHDSVCRFLARRADVGVLAVDYRLAPEHRFPAAVDDAVEAFRWATDNAETLGFDAGRVAVAGDSAGGNLAAVVAQLTRGREAPAAQMLIYPVTDLTKKHASYRLFSNGFFLTEGEMDWYRGHYLREPSEAVDPRASPLLAEDLTGLPPALVLTAGFDVLRDEGEAYAHRLETAGVPTILRRFEGLIHGFANATGLSGSARRAMEDAADNLARMLRR